MHRFDKDYWQRHWDHSSPEIEGLPVDNSANPYVVTLTRTLRPGTALDAGCGTGAETIWLASNGWRVTGVDISGNALALAAQHAAAVSVIDRITWVEADLTSWQPQQQWDLVVTGYAHPAMPQLAFYQRLSQWVAPAGTLLIIGHAHDTAAHGTGSGHQPPEEATVTATDITSGLGPATWSIDSADEYSRTVTAPDGHLVSLRDVVVQATRRTP